MWNHTFYWNSPEEGGGGTASAALAQLIDRDFGSLDNLKKELATAATTQFKQRLDLARIGQRQAGRVSKTSNTELQMTKGQKALLTIVVGTRLPGLTGTAGGLRQRGDRQADQLAIRRGQLGS